MEGSRQSGFRALCRVQGSPLPEVQWFGPDGPLKGSDLQAKDSYQTVSQLLGVEPDQRYTCSASNLQGKDQASLYVLHPRPVPPGPGAPAPLLLLLSVALGLKVVLVLGMGAWLVQGGCCRK